MYTDHSATESPTLKCKRAFNTDYNYLNAISLVDIDYFISPQ